MSRDYHIACLTCDPLGRDGFGRYCDLNHQGAELAKLLPHMEFFAKVRERGFDIDADSLGIWGSTKPEGIGEFALAHRGHEFAIFDEYGERWPEPLPDDIERQAIEAVRSALGRVPPELRSRVMHTLIMEHTDV